MNFILRKLIRIHKFRCGIYWLLHLQNKIRRCEDIGFTRNSIIDSMELPLCILAERNIYAQMFMSNLKN